MLALALALALTPAADAFCGTYVGPAGATMKNHTSTMVLARNGNRTTVTMAGDATTGMLSFGMLIPVPGHVEDVRILDDMGILERIDRYAGPRLVSYTCDDLNQDQSLGGRACNAAEERIRQAAVKTALGHASDALGGFEPGLGSYEVEVLQPSSLVELAAWAADRDWELHPLAERLLNGYIAPGTSFIAVTIDLEEARRGGIFLKPLQFSYESANLTLPVTLGAIHSPGVQDVVVHVITDSMGGVVGVSNYPEFGVESDCMVEVDGESGLDGFYSDAFADGFEEAGGGAAWTTEYTWAATKCDPCPAEGPLEEDVLREVGFTGEPTTATVTRIRARYGADALRGDMMLYESGRSGQSQQRYVAYSEELESEFPVCGDGWISGGGSCPVAGSDNDDVIGTGLPALPAAGVLALGGLLAGRRRQR